MQRPYVEAQLKAAVVSALTAAGVANVTAGWCKLQPVLKAPGCSA